MGGGNGGMGNQASMGGGAGQGMGGAQGGQMVMYSHLNLCCALFSDFAASLIPYIKKSSSLIIEWELWKIQQE